MPHTMFGFRKCLSTQDILLQIKEEVLTTIPKYGENILLALDLKAAFDNVSHRAVLEGLSNIGCGQRIHNYVRAFLSDRSATIGIGGIRTDTFNMPKKGTPQGSVISPTLFNIVMIGLARKLEKIEGLRHAIYADDVTIWVTKGSLGEKQDLLQSAADTVHAYTEHCGLVCSPEKSEVLRVYRRGYNLQNSIDIFIGGKKIPEVSQVKILGMWIQSNCRVDHTIRQLANTTAQITRMIARISNRRRGMKEEDTCRLIQALVISRIVYSVPYQTPLEQEKEQLEAILRKAYKCALGLPVNTSTEKFLQLGINNTVQEHIEAHLLAQKMRLMLTPTGRNTLKILGMRDACREINSTESIPKEIREIIEVSPIPRNMHPKLHKARRKARSEAHNRYFSARKDVLYVDATTYKEHSGAVVSVVDHQLREINCASIKGNNILEAEEAAIALAITHKGEEATTTILTDSQEACRRYSSGRISTAAIRILKTRKITFSRCFITWTPGHETVTGNQRADANARAYANRGAHHDGEPDTVTRRYGAILENQRALRRIYPPPHKDLSREQSVAWRQLQTNTYPNLSLLSKIYPSTYDNKCPLCGEHATLYHVTWACQKPKVAPVHKTPTPEQWEAALSCSKPEEQLKLIDRASKMAEATGALD
ncbi:uncharacterized protein LOC142566781 [Dermacentor variabilis]|uniref:uncharacterized protein LOC142566781 n=1 Tax=Dermacentor variabilis TaxID=34621 RepID=UPI003F5CA760